MAVIIDRDITTEHAELRGYNLPETFKTDYDRIYLVDPFYMNRIK